MISGTRVAIFHDDFEVAANITAFAAQANLELVSPSSIAALEALLSDPLIAAVVLDLAGSKSGGFELIERVANAPCKPDVVVVTALDAKTVDSIRRLGQTKGLKLNVFRKDGDKDAVNACLAGLPKREARFTAAHLGDAIDRQYIRVEYQPKVPLDGAPEEYAVEALCRLTHPHFGNVYPDLFIPIAEREGLIARLTDAVVCQSFRDLAAWREQGTPVRLALNVSPELLKTLDWCEQFVNRCQEFGVEPEHITLEITESQSGATLDVALDVLTRLRLKGFSLSIDDFGTGFSSLATLYKLPFSELKIDKSFTFDLQKSPEARALIETTIGMAQRLGLRVVAEGVESEEVFRELRLMGCQHAQGYFISKSISADSIPQFFAGWTSLMKSEPIREDNALPKIAIIQSLLSDILAGSEEDATLVLPEIGKPPRDGDSTLDLTRNIPSLVLQGQLASALARCHAAGRRLAKNPERSALLGKIRQLRHVLEQELLSKDDLDIAAAGRRVRLLPRQTALIGRPSSAAAVDIAVACRWFSRGDKNLKLYATADGWFVEDLGSTNGSSIGGAILEPGKPYALPIGETLVEIGKRVGGIAPIALRLRRPAASPGAVVMTLLADEAQLSGRPEEKQWPSWREDIATDWVLFEGRLSLGASNDCALVLPDANAAAAAEIWFAEGFWIAPTPYVPLLIAETPFTENTPLPPSADLSVGGAVLRTGVPTPAADPVTAETPQRRAQSR